jgi:hypothetical protein
MKTRTNPATKRDHATVIATLNAEVTRETKRTMRAGIAKIGKRALRDAEWMETGKRVAKSLAPVVAAKAVMRETRDAGRTEHRHFDQMRRVAQTTTNGRMNTALEVWYNS